eukprot:CAMPEP_0185035854 /NCGR_PEP_ID=MMETSP1103-20130426/27905_1 /TAXON_ID=36769 /ORGANISM="Paraphysomonas bandaiensis, Strain Caron Lab Isolate" /LENGTH=2281 /DNA_ID=CAMNT_0027573125 /DNA_START=277 /DNA_END=7122 /DNA_ORIENTATION=-
MFPSHYSFDFSHSTDFSEFSEEFSAAYSHEIFSSVTDTHYPTPFPTSFPTVNPTLSPTLIPTVSPTLTPTLNPTLTPTVNPTLTPTALPTREGETLRPTASPTVLPSGRPSFTPTSAPTLSVGTVWKEAIDTFLSKYPSQGSKRSVYTGIYDGVANEDVVGGCSDLTVFIADDVRTKLITDTVIRLTLASTDSPYDPINASTLVCEGSRESNVDDLDAIIAALTNETAGADTAETYLCNNTEWVVGSCSTGHPALCVGCTNPCTTTSRDYSVTCSSADDTSAMNLLIMDFDVLFVAPSIDSIVLLPNETSITAQITVSAAEGSLVCAAYPTSESFVPSSVSTLQVQGDFISAESTSLEYVIDNLRAATSYDVYCGTASTLNTPMEVGDVLATLTTTKTLCCRVLSVDLASTSFTDDEDVTGALVLDVGIRPTSLTVTITTQYSTSAMGSTSTVAVFSPTSRTFTASVASTASMAYKRSAVGYYTLTASLSGTSAGDYEVVYSLGNSFTVNSSTVEPPPPVLSSARFSNSGNKITVRFSSATNRAGAFNILSKCHNVFSVAGISSKTLCVWLSDTVVDVFVAGNSGPSVGGSLTLMTNTIKAKCTISAGCSSWKYSPSTSVNILTALSPISPSVSIAGPTEIGACDALTFDIASSTGSGGRQWKSVTFSVVGTDASRTSIATFLGTVTDYSRAITVSNSLMVPGNAYTIAVRMCNFLDSCGQDSLSYVISTSQNVPVVRLNSDKLSTTERSKSLSISGEAFSKSCSGSKDSSGLTYSWSIYKDNALLVDNAFKSTSVDTAVFLLPPYTLAVNAIYEVVLTVRHSVSRKYSSASTTVAVEVGDVIAVIDKASAFGLRVSDTVTIDASSSYDEDYSDVTGTAAGLTYSFSCVRVSPTYDEDCGLNITTSTAAITLAVPSQNISYVDSVHEITVFVSHSASSRTAQISTEVTILESLAALVSLSSASGTRVNPSSKLVLQGTVEYPNAGSSVWSVDDTSLALSSVALSPITKVIPSPGAPTGRIQVSLVLPKNILAEQSTYTFSLTVSMSTGHVSTAKFEISTNSPPLVGEFNVDPLNGTEFSTEFLFFTSQWEDSDLPLTYEFSHYASGEISQFRPRKRLSYATSKLPAGRTSTSTYSARVYVYDVLDGVSTTTTEVMVLDNTNITTSDLSNDLAQNLAAGSTTAISSSASVVSSIINFVECSGAPNCFDLNRRNCSQVQDTCGECLSGYVGESGDKNSPCVSETRRRLISTVATTCIVDTDCNSDMFEVCSAGECVVASKTCESDCSGNGVCQFVSAYIVDDSDPHYHVATCDILDSGCFAMCECVSGFAGSYCQYTEAGYINSQAIRQLLVEAYESLVATQNPSSDVVISWISGLVAVSKSSEDMSDETKALMIEVAQDVIDVATTLNLPYEDIAGIEQLLGLTLPVVGSSGRRRLTPEADALALLKAFAQFIIDDIVIGQSAVEVISDLFRISANSYDGLSDTTTFSPQSVVEVLAGTDSHSVSLPADQDGGAFKLLLTEVLVSVYSSTSSNLVQSVPLTMSFDRSLCDTAASNLSTCSFNITLQNFEFGEHVVDEWKEYTTECYSGLVKNHTYSCPSGENLVVECDGVYHGYLISPCPTHVATSQCSSLGAFTGQCEVISFTEDITTCRCSLPGTADPLEAEYTSTASSTLEYHASTRAPYTSSSDDASQSWAVLICTMATIGVTMIAGGFVSFRSPNEGESKVAPALNEFQLVDRSLPDIYQSKPLVALIAYELCYRHRWLQLVFDDYRRVVRILSLFMNVMVVFFLESLVYNYADNRENNCEDETSKSDCEREKSFLGMGDSMCRWSTSNDTCYFKDPDNDFLRILFCAVFVAVLTVPCYILIDILVVHVMFGDSTERGNVSPAPNGRSATAVTAPVKSLDEEFEEMTSAIQLHGAVLDTSAKVEFEDAWRPVNKLLLSDSKYAAMDEIAFFGSGKLSSMECRSRLVFLFLRDFLVGSVLQIVSSKDRRDNKKQSVVGVHWKAAGWVLYVCANAGMFCYIIIFAVNEDRPRQRAWVFTYFAYLIMDIFLVSVFFVLWTHVCIPLAASKPVQLARENLVRIILDLQSSDRPPSTFNAAKYLFTSHRVASALTSVEEQSVVMRFGTVWPKTYFESQRVVLPGTHSKPLGWFYSIAAACVAMPLFVHDFVVSLILTAGIGYIAILHVHLFRVNPGYVVIPAAGVIALVFILGIVYGAARYPDVASPAVQPAPAVQTVQPHTSAPEEQLVVSDSPGELLGSESTKSQDAPRRAESTDAHLGA